MRDLVLNDGAVLPITKIIDKAQAGSSILKNASWTLSNLFKGDPSPNFSEI
jgi:importin subunit alpha-6/7